MAPMTATPSAVGARLSPEDKTALNTYLLRMEKLERANDWQGLQSLMSEECITMPPRHTTMEGREAWLQWIRETGFHVSDLEVQPQEFDGCGDLAFLRCNYRWVYTHESRPEPVVDTGRFLGVLRKQPSGEWLGTHWMWNSDRRRRPGP